MHLITVLPLLCAIAQITSAAKCYSMDGEVLDETHKPCNPDAEFSACCALNGTSPDNDICLDSGLCQSTSGWFAGFIYADGCSDKSGQASECPHFCDGMPQQYNFNVLQCNPGTFCCRPGYSSENCCNNTAALVNTTHVGTLLLPNGQAINTTYVPGSVAGGASATATADCRARNSDPVAIGVGVVLGLLLIATITGMGIMAKRSAKFKRELNAKQAQFHQMAYQSQTSEQKISQMHHAAPPYQSTRSCSSYQSSHELANGQRPVEMENRGLSELSN